MDDARDLVRRSRRAKTAVVVGGGVTALELVEGLRARRVHVHYFMRKDRYWSNVLSESESRIVEQALLREGVEIHSFTELARIHGRDGRVTAAESGDGTRIPCDLVAVAVGVRPRIELAAAAGLECGRGILVDQYLRSSDHHVFAAGDVAEVCDARTGHRVLDVLWNTAVTKGRVAGLNMATAPVHTFAEGTPLNVTRLAGLHATIIGTVGNGEDADLEGIARGDSQIWSELCDAAIVEAQRGDAHIRLALEEGAIVGAVVVGDQALSFPLQELIEARVDLSAIEAALEAPEAPIVELINAAWRDWKERLV
jgi:NAD(P)H-nitrite reductase large subunit